MKNLIAVVVGCLVIVACKHDYQYSSRIPYSDMPLLEKTSSNKAMTISCNKSVLVLDSGYGEYLSKIPCTNTQIELVYNQVRVDPNCYNTKYTSCAYKFDGTITISSNKAIPLAISTINEILEEKYQSDTTR